MVNKQPNSHPGKKLARSLDDRQQSSIDNKLRSLADALTSTPEPMDKAPCQVDDFPQDLDASGA